MTGVTRSHCSPEAIRRELVTHYWQVVKLPTTAIAERTGLTEDDVCRIIEDVEGKDNARTDRG